MERVLLESIGHDMRSGRDYKSKLIKFINVFYASQSDAEMKNISNKLSSLSLDNLTSDEILRHLLKNVVPGWYDYFAGKNREMVVALTNVLWKIMIFQTSISGFLMTTTPDIEKIFKAREEDLTKKYIFYLFKLEELKFCIHKLKMSGLLRLPSPMLNAGVERDGGGYASLKNLLLLVENYFDRPRLRQFVPKDQRLLKECSEYTLKRLIYFIITNNLNVDLPVLSRKYFTYSRSGYNAKLHGVYDALRIYAKFGYNGRSNTNNFVMFEDL